MVAQETMRGRGQIHDRSRRSDLLALFLPHEDHSAVQPRRDRDRRLINGLRVWDASRRPEGVTDWDLSVRHPDLVPLLHRHYTPATLSPLRQRLESAGTFRLHTDERHRVIVDGGEQTITIVKATPVEANGDMDGKVWARDQNEGVKTKLTGLKYRFVQGAKEQDLAHRLVASTTDLLSTSEQLNRYASIIADNRLADNYLLWPQIAWKIDDEHLGSIKATRWRHTQEAAPKVALSVFDALDLEIGEDRFLSVDQLKAGNKQFLAYQVPFLAAVDYTKRRNSGPWEEEMAVRTSVMGVETALLYAISEHAGKDGFEFLEKGFEDAKPHLMRSPANTSFSNNPLTKETKFDKALEFMVQKGLTTIGQRLPFEAVAEEDLGTIRERHADVALIDLLEYGIPELLEKKKIPIRALGNKPASRIEIEDLILHEVGKLFDRERHGFLRFGVPGDHEDTYLRGNFATNGIQADVMAVKRALDDQAGDNNPIDLELKAELRELITSGKPPVWVHPIFQIAAWAGEMKIKVINKAKEEGRVVDMNEVNRYRIIAEDMLNEGVAALTGPDEQHSLLNGDETHHIQSVGELEVPECWTTLVTSDEIEFEVASPHSPLTEGATIADRAFGLLHQGLLAQAA